jgi:lipase
MSDEYQSAFEERSCYPGERPPTVEWVMVLNVRTWGEAEHGCVVCVHGVTQHGAIFEPLGKRLADLGFLVLAVDLRGHGASDRMPPWSTDRHAQDLLETLSSRGVRRATLVGHSFGGRVAAAAAASAPELTERLVLLDPGLEIPPARALRGAEMDRLDWSFETPEGAVNALTGGSRAPRSIVADYVEENVHQGSDGRYRFGFCPGAVVTAWSEMCLPAPPIAEAQTLVVCSEASAFAASLEQRYRAALGPGFARVQVPGGHNMLWESREETVQAVEGFLLGAPPPADPQPGYIDGAGAFQPLL